MPATGCPNPSSLQLVHKRLAVQSLGLLVEVEGQCFERRLATFLPLLHHCLSLQAQQEDDGDSRSATERNGFAAPASSAMPNNGDLLESQGRGGEEREGGKVEEEGEGEAALDSLLFSTLMTLEKICSQWLMLCRHQHSCEMKRIWGIYIEACEGPQSWLTAAVSSSCRGCSLPPPLPPLLGEAVVMPTVWTALCCSHTIRVGCCLQLLSTRTEEEAGGCGVSAGRHH